MQRTKWLSRTAAFLFLPLIALELLLRVLGFGQGAIYVADPDYEYMHAPNQRTRPFGHLVLTNKYGMRSNDLQPGDDVHVLVLGDSVVNGGNPIDHDALATTLLEKSIQRRFGPKARALNISAGGWGPDNAAAYLKKRGVFGTRTVIAVFSSHDLGDVMLHNPIVGRDPGFADSYPTFVCFDVWNRYVWTTLRAHFSRTSGSQESPGTAGFKGQLNPGWSQLRDILQMKHIPLHVVLHKDLAEFLSGDFSAQGHQLIAYLRSIGIEPLFEYGFSAGSYRDSIHLSIKGHADMARVLDSVLR